MSAGIVSYDSVLAMRGIYCTHLDCCVHLLPQVVFMAVTLIQLVYNTHTHTHTHTHSHVKSQHTAIGMSVAGVCVCVSV